MLRWFTQTAGKICQPEGIIVQPSPLHGRGVFAEKKFTPGAVIETAPVILMHAEDKEQLSATTLFHYYFVVGHAKYPVALGLGYTSLYNHSNKANAVYSISIAKASITIKACKNILPGDEITLNYNGTPDDDAPVYFPDADSPS
ncbi:MAG: SET domain-containing protein-lysine N-methyltransferase [Bacteroidetes bacterium]|nr:SET domain-containing protein-lysine N-methyltransferase [Bacteroidota bacterium]